MAASRCAASFVSPLPPLSRAINATKTHSRDAQHVWRRPTNQRMRYPQQNPFSHLKGNRQLTFYAFNRNYLPPVLGRDGFFLLLSNIRRRTNNKVLTRTPRIRRVSHLAFYTLRPFRCVAIGDWGLGKQTRSTAAGSIIGKAGERASIGVLACMRLCRDCCQREMLHAYYYVSSFS